MRLPERAGASGITVPFTPVGEPGEEPARFGSTAGEMELRARSL